jgi:hypothetical protein
MKMTGERKCWATAGALLLLAMALPQRGRAQQPTAATATATAADRQSLAITIYNSNFALIRDTRRVSLPAGAVRLAFEAVPTSIEPATVQLTGPSGLDVLDESYEYDVLSPERLLEKYVGKEITLVIRRQQSGADHDEDVKATVLNQRPGVEDRK